MRCLHSCVWAPLKNFEKKNNPDHKMYVDSDVVAWSGREKPTFGSQYYVKVKTKLGTAFRIG